MKERRKYQQLQPEGRVTIASIVGQGYGLREIAEADAATHGGRGSEKPGVALRS